MGPNSNNLDLDLDGGAAEYRASVAAQSGNTMARRDLPFMPPVDLTVEGELELVFYSNDNAGIYFKILKEIDGKLPAPYKSGVSVFICHHGFARDKCIKQLYLATQGKDADAFTMAEVDFEQLATIYTGKQPLKGKKVWLQTYLGPNADGEPHTYHFWKPVGSKKDLVSEFKAAKKAASERKKRYSNKGR